MPLMICMNCKKKSSYKSGETVCKDLYCKAVGALKPMFPCSLCQKLMIGDTGTSTGTCPNCRNNMKNRSTPRTTLGKSTPMWEIARNARHRRVAASYGYLKQRGAKHYTPKEKKQPQRGASVPTRPLHQSPQTEVDSKDDLALRDFGNKFEKRLQFYVLFIPFNAKKIGLTEERAGGVYGYPLKGDADLSKVNSLNGKDFKTFEGGGVSLEDAGKPLRPSTTNMAEFALQEIDQYSRHSPSMADSRYPDIVFLSEEPGATTKGKLTFPDRIQPSDMKYSYQTFGSIRNSFGKVRSENSIMAYMRVGADAEKRYSYECEYVSRQVKKNITITTKNYPQEHWLVVTKTDNYSGLSLRLAAVHLTSKYTSVTNSGILNKIHDEVKTFAVDNRIDALLGDLNMDTRSIEGGNFVRDYDIDMTTSEPSAYTTVTQSSSNHKRNYMGGLILSKEVSIDTLNLQGVAGGTGSSSIVGTGGERLYVTDHPSIAARYVKVVKGSHREMMDVDDLKSKTT